MSLYDLTTYTSEKRTTVRFLYINRWCRLCSIVKKKGGRSQLNSAVCPTPCAWQARHIASFDFSAQSKLYYRNGNRKSLKSAHFSTFLARERQLTAAKLRLSTSESSERFFAMALCKQAAAIPLAVVLRNFIRLYRRIARSGSLQPAVLSQTVTDVSSIAVAWVWLFDGWVQTTEMPRILRGCSRGIVGFSVNLFNSPRKRKLRGASSERAFSGTIRNPGFRHGTNSAKDLDVWRMAGVQHISWRL